MKRSICRLGCELGWAEGFWAEGSTSSVVLTRWRKCAHMQEHIGATSRILLNRPLRRQCDLLSNYLTTSYCFTNKMDKDKTWHRGRPRPWPHCVRWGPSSSPSQNGNSPQFSANVCYGQTAGWIKMPLGRKVGLSPDHIALDRDPAPLPKKWPQPPLPTFRSISFVDKRLDESRCHFVGRYTWAKATLCSLGIKNKCSAVAS